MKTAFLVYLLFFVIVVGALLWSCDTQPPPTPWWPSACEYGGVARIENGQLIRIDSTVFCPYLGHWVDVKTEKVY